MEATRVNFLSVRKQDVFNRDLGLFLAYKSVPPEPYSVSLCRSFNVVEVKENQGALEPSVVLSATLAQTLMDELWNCGVRPSEGSGSAGSLAATQKHLEDMKKIAFNALRIKG